MLTVAVPKRNKLPNIIVLTPKDGDLSLPIVWAMAVLVELLVIPVRMILRSSKVKCEKAFVVFI